MRLLVHLLSLDPPIPYGAVTKNAHEIPTYAVVNVISFLTPVTKSDWLCGKMPPHPRELSELCLSISGAKLHILLLFVLPSLVCVNPLVRFAATLSLIELLSIRLS